VLVFCKTISRAYEKHKNRMAHLAYKSAPLYLTTARPDVSHGNAGLRAVETRESVQERAYAGFDGLYRYSVARDGDRPRLDDGRGRG